MFPELFSVAGKTALITGGSRGIGYMIAEGYLRAGCVSTSRHVSPMPASWRSRNCRSSVRYTPSPPTSARRTSAAH